MSQRPGEPPVGASTDRHGHGRVDQLPGLKIPFHANPAPLALQVEDVAAARAELEIRGVEIAPEDIDSGVCHMANFKNRTATRSCSITGTRRAVETVRVGADPLAAVQRRDPVVLLLGELEAEDVHVLRGCAQGVTDFGNTTLPSCRCQRRTTWAASAVLGAIPDDGVVEDLALPQRGPGLGRDTAVCVFARSSGCARYGCSSIWLTAGAAGFLSSAAGAAPSKFDTPTDASGPASRLDQRPPGIDVVPGGRGQWIRYRSTWSRPSRSRLDSSAPAARLVAVPQLRGNEELRAAGRSCESPRRPRLVAVDRAVSMWR